MAVENNIGSMDIAISGLKAQNRQMQIISNNIANARIEGLKQFLRLKKVLAALNWKRLLVI